MDVAVPVQPRTRQRVGDGDPGGRRSTPTSSSSRARPPASRPSAPATGVTGRGRRRRRGSYSQATDNWSSRRATLEDYYDACKPAARAAYCQDGQSYTKNGTLVDLFDTRQIIWPNWVENPFNASNPIVVVDDGAGVLLVDGTEPGTTRAEGLGAAAQPLPGAVARSRCGNFAYIDRLEHDHIEDGRWAGPLTNNPRIQVFSPTDCTHNEYKAGPSRCRGIAARARPRSARPARVLRRGRRPGLGRHVHRRGRQCLQDGRGAVAEGRGVAERPAASPPTRSCRSTCSVRRAPWCASTARSSPGSSVTVSGWACDPEWPGATVGVQNLRRRAARTAGQHAAGRGARRSGAGGAAGARGRARLRRPVASYTRHGFSFTLPANHSGNVFVYAIDQTTVDGPAAPPTLLRNGIVPVPRCAHSEHVAGVALDAACSACATSICNDGPHGDVLFEEWTDACAAAADSCAPPPAPRPPTATRTPRSRPAGSRRRRRRLHVRFVAAAEPAVRQRQQGARLVRDVAGNDAGIDHAVRRSALPPALGSLPGGAGSAARGRAHVAGARHRRAGADPVVAALPAGARRRQRPDRDVLHDRFVRRRAGHAPGRIHRHQQGHRAAVDAEDGPAGRLRPVVLRDLGRRDRPVVHRAVHVLRRRWRYPGAVRQRRGVTFATPAPSTAPGGCAHDLCLPGDKLDASCNSCVHDVCQADPYCCNGGYLSYYSLEPVWDARCIAEVQTYCAPATCAPVRHRRSRRKRSRTRSRCRRACTTRFASHTRTRQPTRPSACCGRARRRAKQVIPPFALYPKAVTPAGLGAGLNVTLFADATSASRDGHTRVDHAGGRGRDHRPVTVAGGRSRRDACRRLAGATVDTVAGKPLPPMHGPPALRRRGIRQRQRPDQAARRRRHHGRLDPHHGGWRRGRHGGAGRRRRAVEPRSSDRDRPAEAGAGAADLPGRGLRGPGVLRRERPAVLAAEGDARDGVAQCADHLLAHRSGARSVAQRRAVHGRRPRDVRAPCTSSTRAGWAPPSAR